MNRGENTRTGTDERTTSRRKFLKIAGATTGALSTAGCLDLFGLTPESALGPAGLGGGAVYPNVSEADATAYARTADELEALATSGEIVWIPDEVTLDLTDRPPILVDNNTTIASGRSESSTGALITSSGRGASGEHHMFTIEQGHMSGLTMRGALYNYTDSPVVPGYVPLGQGSTYEARQNWRNDWYCRAIEIHSEGSGAQVDNCEIWGFSTAIAVGLSGTASNPNIFYCHIHNCMMTSDGYCVHVNRGIPRVHGCTFNAYRHAINGFGYADAGYYVTECRFGPYKSSFDIDMHRMEENITGSGDSGALDYRHRAGGQMVVANSIIMGTEVIDDRHHNGGANAGTYSPTPYVNQHKGNRARHVHIRGIPAEEFRFVGNHCEHSDPGVAVHQTVPGSYPTDANGWYRMTVEGNTWGVQF